MIQALPPHLLKHFIKSKLERQMMECPENESVSMNWLSEDVSRSKLILDSLSVINPYSSI